MTILPHSRNCGLRLLRKPGTDGRLKRRGKCFAMRIRRNPDWGMCDHLNAALSFCGQSAEQVWSEFHITPPAIKTRVFSVWGHIADGDWLDRHVIFKLIIEESRKERGFERQNLTPIA